MENENQVKNEEVKNECKHPMHHKMHMIAIILSIVAIVFSSFSLGFTISANRKQDRHDNRFAMQDNMMGMPKQFNPWTNNNQNKKGNRNQFQNNSQNKNGNRSNISPNGDNKSQNRFDKPSDEKYTPEFNRPAKENAGPTEQNKN